MNKSIVRFLAVCLLAGSVAGAESPWRITNRLQFAQEHDSNVEEALHGPRAASASRLVFQTKMNRVGRRVKLHLSYLGGLSLYNAFASENKLINESSLNFKLQLNKRLAAGVNTFARLKLFLNRDADYVYGTLQPYLNYYAGNGWSLRAGFENELLDYAQATLYDFTVRSLFAACSRRFADGTSIGIVYRHKSFLFDRTITVLNLGFPSSLERQQDDRDQISFYCDFLAAGWLLNLSYFYESNHSNSYGFSYNRHMVNLIAAREIEHFLLRAYLTVQKKRYTDRFLPTWPTELDSEREQSNFAVIDVSRDLTDIVTAMVRVAWYRNESPWASLYYDKTVLSAGIELRFPSK